MPLAQRTSSPLSRAQRLPQHGGPSGQQHPVGAGLRQAADPAAVRALLPPSPPLRPQRRTTAQERRPAAGRVSESNADGMALSVIRLETVRRGSGKYPAAVFFFFLQNLCLIRTHSHTHCSSVRCLWVSTLQV